MSLLKHIIFIVLTSFCAAGVHAESCGQTPYPEKSRVIIRESEAVVTTGSLTVINPGSCPWLMQTWLEDEHGVRKGHVYPELSRLEETFSRRLLVAPALSQWHEEREGLNWLVIRLIPSTERNDHNRLIIPVELRLKVFLRSRLAGAEQEKPELSCDMNSDGRLMLYNRGRHYVTLTELKGGTGRMAEGVPLIVAPGGQQAVGRGMTSGAYKYGYVDDRGIIDYGRMTCR